MILEDIFNDNNELEDNIEESTPLLEDFDNEPESEEKEIDTIEEAIEESTEEIQEEIQEQESEQEEEYEEIELADYIDDSFLPPDNFKTQKEELQWYKEKYTELLSFYNKPEFIESFAKEYEKILIEKEEERDKLIAIKNVFENKPELAIKLYAPQYLFEKGHDPLLKEEEIYDMIDNALKEEFGEDYKEIFKPEHANNPNTISGKMFLRQKQLLEKIETHQQEVQKLIEDYKPVTQDDINKSLEMQYNDFKEIYTKEEYNKFVEEFKSKVKTWKLKDYHKLVYFNDYLENAYKKGYEKGIKEQSQKLKRIKNDLSINDSTQEEIKNRKVKIDKIQTPFYLRKEYWS